MSETTDTTGQAGELTNDEQIDAHTIRGMAREHLANHGGDPHVTPDYPPQVLIRLMDAYFTLTARCAAAELERDALQAIERLAVNVVACLAEFEDEPQFCAEWVDRLDDALSARIDFEGGYPGEPDLMAEALDRMSTPPPDGRGG